MLSGGSPPLPCFYPNTNHLIRANMSKYLHEYNEGRCRTCSRTALFETDDAGNISFKENKPIKKANLMICTSCKSVQYCCKEHQVEDWPSHKKFCKRFRKLIAEYKMMRVSRIILYSAISFLNRLQNFLWLGQSSTWCFLQQY